ncbi:MAG: hypothetical protein P1U41_00600 [Vicingaceae bacterium]|nr:hypothetical protein [Vicingaceae bacterium]
MKNIVLKTTACLALFTLTINVNAQDTKGERLSQQFTKLDTNNDSFLDKTEAAKFKDGKMTKNFVRIDTNKDDKITLEELKAYRVKRKQAKKAAAAK